MNQYSSTWTDEKVEELKRLWADGISASQIGKTFDVSRSAVLGKVFRLGLATRTQARKISDAKKRTRKPRKSFGWQPTAPKIKAEPFVPVIVNLPPLDIAFNELKPGQCKWIAGEPIYDAPCCGHATDGKTYCPAHCRVAYVAPRERKDAVRPRFRTGDQTSANAKEWLEDAA